MKNLACMAMLAFASPLVAAQPQSPGERLVKAQCIQCHTVGKGEPHGAGPNLFGIVGRSAVGADGFKYSDRYIAAMQVKTWDARLLDKWLADTQAVAPGNGMTYFQDDARKRRQIVDYLATLK